MRKFEYVSRMESNGYECITPEIPLPERSTKNSAGYDFYNPEDVTIKAHEIKYVKTGIKAYMEDDEMLLLCNRSSNPKKKKLVVINGVRDSGRRLL